MEVIADTVRWKACNLRFTSLMEANMRWGPAKGRFLDADTLARRIVADGPPATVVEDEELWRSSNLHRTSLIAANLAWPGRSGHRFLDAPKLAAEMVAAERSTAGEGGSSAGA
jgi:hypothetical protein